MEEKIQANTAEIAELREAAEKHQSTHEMMVNNLRNHSSEIPDSLKRFMRDSAFKAREAVMQTEANIKDLQNENLSMTMLTMERRLNEVQVKVEHEGPIVVTEGSDHSQCLTYKRCKMRLSDHSHCKYVKWSAAT